MAGCAASFAGAPLVEGLIATTDCQLQAVVHISYGAFFGGGGIYSPVLTALLTVFVALFGYRLLLGSTQPTMGEVTINLLKLGVVVALASQWDSYQVVVARLLFEGPQQIASRLLHQLTGGDHPVSDVFRTLQGVFDELMDQASAGTVPARPPGLPASPVGDMASNAVAPSSQSGGTLLFAAAIALMLSTLGLLIAAKIVLALLLALGPVFIAMFLFDSTRGLFAGWVRASVASALTPLTITILLALCLAVLQPLLEQLANLPQHQASPPAVAVAILIVVLVFAISSVGLAFAVGLLAAGFTLPPGWPRPQTALIWVATENADSRLAASQTRAERIVAAVVALDRRGARGRAEPVIATESLDRHILVGATSHGPAATNAIVPVGEITRRSRGPKSSRLISKSQE